MSADPLVWGEPELVTRAAIYSDSAGGSSQGSTAISADGRYTAFISNAPNLVSGLELAAGVNQVYRYDRLAGEIVLVSVNAAGTGGGSGLSSTPVISADGSVVAFLSNATNLHPLDTNTVTDVYARSLTTGTTHLVTMNAAGTGSANGDAAGAMISADGVVVAFQSSANNLHPADTNTRNDVFARNLATGALQLVSMNAAGTNSGNGISTIGAISADGAVVAFQSSASDLHPLDTNTTQDVLARNLTTGITSLVSVNTAGTGSGNGVSIVGSMSADGSVVAFQSNASNLHPLDTNTTRDVLTRNLTTGATLLVSVNTAGSGSGNGISSNPRISADGSTVAFESDATNLHPLDTNTLTDVYARNLATNATHLVSVNADGTGSGNGRSNVGAISVDGSIVAFRSGAINLHPLDTNLSADVYARNLATGATQLVSMNAAGTGSGNGSSSVGAISADGSVVAFESNANDLVANDYNTFRDVFLGELGSSPATLVTRVAAGMFSETAGATGTPVTSADGRFVAFASGARNLVSGANVAPGIYRYDRLTGEMAQASADVTTGSSHNPSISADGAVVAFMNNAGIPQIYARDFASGITHLVSVDVAGNGSGNSASLNPTISADGSVVMFESTASNLHPLDTNNISDIFARNLTTGTTHLVSVSSDGTGSSDQPSGRRDFMEYFYGPSAINADGSVVAFVSQATNLHPLDTETNLDVFVRNLNTGITHLVSVNAAGTASGFYDSGNPTISADGSIVAFESTASNLHPLDTDDQSDVFARNLTTGTTRLVSVSADGLSSANGEASLPVISADGSVVAYLNGGIFARDLTTGITHLVGGSSFSGAVRLSADGSIVAFDSPSALHPLDSNSAPDVYARDLATNTTYLVSVNADGTGSGNNSPTTGLPVSLSADGRVIVFGSNAANLTAGDWNSATDIFAVANLTPPVEPVTAPEELASAVTSLPPGTTEVQVTSTPTSLDLFVEAIADLTPNVSGTPIDIVINLSEGDYSEGRVIDVPAGYRVIINGASGQVVFHGNSPSLIVQSGDVLVTGVTFVNSTDASTILVTGGSLTVRNSSIIETTGGIRSAIEATGGSVDLGTLANPGGNTIVLSGAGDFVHNATDSAIPAYGNAYQVGSTTITSDHVVDAGKRLTFDPSSGSVVLASDVTIVAIDLRPTSLNIDQNGSISLVIFGSSLFDVSQVSIESLSLAGVGIDVFSHSFVDDNHDGTTDLVVQLRSSEALKAALTSLYADLLLEDYGDDGLYDRRQEALIALDGLFGDIGQEFQGSDFTNLFLSGNSLKTLLTALGI